MNGGGEGQGIEEGAAGREIFGGGLSFSGPANTPIADGCRRSYDGFPCQDEGKGFKFERSFW